MIPMADFYNHDDQPESGFHFCVKRLHLEEQDTPGYFDKDEFMTDYS